MTTINEKYATTLERIENEKRAVQAKFKKNKDDLANYINKLLNTDYYKKQINDYLSEKGFLILFFQENSCQNEILKSDIQKLIDHYSSEGVMLDTKRVFLKNTNFNRNFCFLFFCTRNYLGLHFNNNLNDFVNHFISIAKSEDSVKTVFVSYFLNLKNFFDGRLFPLLDLNVILKKLPYNIESGKYKTVEYIDCIPTKEKKEILKSFHADYDPLNTSYENLYLNFISQIIYYFFDISNKILFEADYDTGKLTDEGFIDAYVQLMTDYNPILKTILSKFDEKLIRTGDIMHPHTIYGF